MDELPRVQNILEQQARLAELRERLAEVGGESARRALTHLHLTEGPWLTISRQLGAGALSVARDLAGELGWQIFDQEIVAAIARHTHTREQVLSGLDEHAARPLNEYIAHLFGPDRPGSASVAIETVRVIWGIARRGNAIIVGRGANCFLDSRYGLRVRMIRPFDERATRLSRERSIDPSEAEKSLRAHDRDQAEYIRRTHRAEIDDPARYDLVLNLGGLSRAAAAGICLAALESKLEGAG